MGMDAAVPFALDVSDPLSPRPLAVGDVDPERYDRGEYHLVCPCCGGDVLYKRHRTADAFGTPWYLSHRAEASDECVRLGEGGFHAFAKALLKASVGRWFRLPAVGTADHVPHVSRLRDGDGALRWGYAASRPRRPSEIDLAREAGLEIDLLAMDPVAYRIVDVELERDFGGKVRADAYLTLESADRTEALKVPVEIRDSHAKGLGEVRAYAGLGMSVIEVFVQDLSLEDVSRHLDPLWARLLGTPGLENDRREWLYFAGVKEKALSRYHLGFFVETPGLARSFVEKRIGFLGVSAYAPDPARGAFVLESRVGPYGVFRHGPASPLIVGESRVSLLVVDGVVPPEDSRCLLRHEEFRSDLFSAADEIADEAKRLNEEEAEEARLREATKDVREPYAIVRSERLSDEYGGDRFVIVETATGKTWMDGNGRGYRSYERAENQLLTSTDQPGFERRKERRRRAARAWWREHPEVMDAVRALSADAMADSGKPYYGRFRMLLDELGLDLGDLPLKVVFDEMPLVQGSAA